MERLKSIDGLRAIAITMVVLGHAAHTIPAYVSQNYLYGLVSNASLGVRVFFVISGYLITKLLLAEERKTTTINIKHFYLRRLLRIFPVFYLYIFVIVILKLFFIPDIFQHYALVMFAGLYLWNYKHLFTHSDFLHDKGSWFFGHFWSLAMEEQFYLLWPLAFKNINKKLLTKIVLSIILVMPALRVATYFLVPNSRGQITMMLHTGGDTILVGCLGALLEERILRHKRMNALFNNTFFVVISFTFVFLVSPYLGKHFSHAYGLAVGRFADNFVILFVLLWSVHFNSAFSRIMNAAVLVHVGILSYSIYIWQQLILTNEIHYTANSFPLNIFILLAIATGSYYIIEKPILGLKKRLMS